MKPDSQNRDIKGIVEEIEHPLSLALEGLNLLKSHFDNHHDLRNRQVYNSVVVSVERAAALFKGLSESLDVSSDRGACHFDILQQIQQVTSTHDQLFLQRQLRYRVMASAELPKAFANPDQIFVVLSNLISNAIRFAPRGSEIEMHIKEVKLRQGAGVEVSVINESPDFTEKDRYHIFEKFYTAKPVEGQHTTGLGLAVSREILQKAGGQIWVDIPAKGKVSFTFVLPCAEVVHQVRGKGHQTYKYDIAINNYKEIKENYGSEKCQALLHRIEGSVRKLVRYPIDVVAAFETNGVISTIYETQEGSASSVATRISQKLGEEGFKVGKDSEPVTFKYHLSILQ